MRLVVVNIIISFISKIYCSITVAVLYRTHVQWDILADATALPDLRHVAVQTQRGDHRAAFVARTKLDFGRGSWCSVERGRISPFGARVSHVEGNFPRSVPAVATLSLFVAAHLGATAAWFVTVFLYLRSVAEAIWTYERLHALLFLSSAPSSFRLSVDRSCIRYCLLVFFLLLWTFVCFIGIFFLFHGMRQ